MDLFAPKNRFKTLTAAFVLCIGALLILIRAHVVVAMDYEWLFYAFVVAYAIGIILLRYAPRSTRKRRS